MWMGMYPEFAIYLPWDIWILGWVAASLWAKPTLKRVASIRQWPYRLLEFGGFVVLLGIFVDTGHPRVTGSPFVDFMYHPFWYLPEDAKWALVGVAASGFLFCGWARLTLGPLWSGTITRKEDHRIVETGPYRLVRHPIYTGILAASLATMLVKGTGHAILGMAMLTAGLWLKARLEERFLREELGAEAYDAYRQRVPMLIPFASV